MTKKTKQKVALDRTLIGTAADARRARRHGAIGKDLEDAARKMYGIGERERERDRGECGLVGGGQAR